MLRSRLRASCASDARFTWKGIAELFVMRMGLAIGFLKNLKRILLSLTVHCKSRMGIKLEGCCEGKSEVRRMNGDIEFPISRRMDEVLKSSGMALSLSISVHIVMV